MRPENAAMANFFAPLPRFLNTTVLCSASTEEYLLLHSITFTEHVYLYLYAMFCIKVLIIYIKVDGLECKCLQYYSIHMII